MKILYIICLLLASTAHSQQLESWRNTIAENNPQEYVNKAINVVPATPKEVAGYYYVLARCYYHLNNEDVALKYYLLSKKQFEKLKMTGLAKELALEIYQLLSSQENYDKYSAAFLEEYYTYAKKTKDNYRLAAIFNEFGKNSTIDYDNSEDSKYLDTAEGWHNKALKYSLKADNTVLNAKIYSNLAAVALYRNNFSAARQLYNKAHYYIKKSGDSYELFVNQYNQGINYYYEGDYNNAVLWLKKAEQITIPQFHKKRVRALYKYLAESYDALNKHTERRYYQKLHNKLDDEIKDEEQNIAIHDINVKYEVAKKDRQISSLEDFKDKFHKNRLVFGILLFLVFLLALYSFIRWKKIDYHKKRLELEKNKVEEEKTEIQQKHTKTVEELEKVKKIVTEGYIVLKDKTKIYLSDLMYVKAEDHYLNAVSKEGKKHFVRGKLSQLLLELPPNFVKCHRSYIVNINYIQSLNANIIVLKSKEEIPASRGFKL